MQPKVSIIVPVYNVARFLRECLDSLVNQTLKEIEIICFNDASTDNSLEILNEYSAKYPCVQVVDSKINIKQGGEKRRHKNLKSFLCPVC